jgi:hypothetical protein
MATIRHLEPKQLEIVVRHTEVAATYAIVRDSEGVKYLQIDTYGSEEREIRGKKSQSMRLAPEAIAQLVSIASKHFAQGGDVE